MGKPSKNTANIALERIKILFDNASKEFKNHPERSNRYVSMAMKIATKTRTRLPKTLKSRFCKKCLSYLVPGINSRVRINHGKIIGYCFKCKNYRRIQLK